MAGGKFTIKSRTWNTITAVGIAVLFLLGFGGLFYIQGSIKPDGTTMLLFLVILGIVTFLLFAGPGLLYPGRKRVAFLKKILPGGTMAWVRAHMYMPAIAVAAAIVHGTSEPFRSNLSSGKILLVLSVLVVISGYFRHHMISLQKSALNVNVEITKLTTGQTRHFRDLVSDFLDNRRPLAEIEAEMATTDRAQQVLWAEVKRLAGHVHTNFPREGGQSTKVIHYKMWKALHPPLTIALFIVLAFHVWDVFGASHRVVHSAVDNFATSQSCAGCHSQIFEDWSTSSMAHAQTGLVMRAQLPVTLRENVLLAAQKGAAQQKILDTNAKVCISCHAQVGARLAKTPTAVLPFNQDNSSSVGTSGKAVSSGSAAAQSDGVGCIVCHTQATPPVELSGGAEMSLGKAMSTSDYRTQYGPLFTGPKSVPVRVHAQEQGTIAGKGSADMWSSPVQSSQVCGACHDVKVDLNGNGTSGVPNSKSGFTDAASQTDSDKNFILDQNELDLDKNGKLQDLVLQTTYDEWQDYLVGYKARFATEQRAVPHGTEPLGCVQCHMPTSTKGKGKIALVDHAPGFLPLPKRNYQSHDFVGIDYDLDPTSYKNLNGQKDALPEILAERQALAQSAVTLQVDNKGQVKAGVFQANVKVQNNFLGHAFPTGFAFARQFWLEVTAVDTTGGKNSPVCPAAAGPTLPAGPGCGSGVNIKADQPLPQCDPVSVKAALSQPNGAKLTLKGDAGKLDAAVDPNNFFLKDNGVVFSKNGSLPVGACDPWLANFQKILTDGGATDPNVFNEVAYQSLLPDIVKLRTRVATDQVMAPLESVRLKAGVDDPTSMTIPYAFDVSKVPAGDLPNIKVTVKMHLRHLPPEFLDSLEQNQKDLKITLPEGAKLNAAAAKAGLRIDDGTADHPVALASSGDGVKLACEGPQNKVTSTVLACSDQMLPATLAGQAAPATPVARGGRPTNQPGNTVPAAFHRPGDGLAADRRQWPFYGAVLIAFLGATSLLRRRLVR